MSLTIFAGYQKTLPAVQYALQRSFLSRVLVEGNHYASCFGARGVWFPAPHLVPREGFKNKPVIWRLEWPQYIIDQLVTTDNPSNTISNSSARPTTSIHSSDNEQVVPPTKRSPHTYSTYLAFTSGTSSMFHDMTTCQALQMMLLMHSLVTFTCLWRMNKLTLCPPSYHRA